MFYDTSFDGILGLAFPALSVYDFVPIVDNLFVQNLLVRRAWGVLIFSLLECGVFKRLCCWMLKLWYYHRADKQISDKCHIVLCPSVGLKTTKVFSFYFSNWPTQNSVLLFGPPEPGFYEGSLQWFPVVRKFYWELRLYDVEV